MYHKEHTENLKEDYSGYEEVENMLINQEFINHLTPVEISFIRIGIDKLFKEKVTSETTNYENVSAHAIRLCRLLVASSRDVATPWRHGFSISIITKKAGFYPCLNLGLQIVV